MATPNYDPNDPKGHYNTNLKVPEEVIQQIRDMGMARAIEQANSAGVSKEFKEGVRRFYPAAIDDIKESNETAASAIDPKLRAAFEGGDPSVSTSPIGSSSGPQGVPSEEPPLPPVEPENDPTIPAVRADIPPNAGLSNEAIQRRFTQDPTSPVQENAGANLPASMGGNQSGGPRSVIDELGLDQDSLIQAGREHSPMGTPIPPRMDEEGEPITRGGRDFGPDNLRALLSKLVPPSRERETFQEGEPANRRLTPHHRYQ